MAAASKKKESIGRLFRRPGSVFVNRATVHERSGGAAGSSRLMLVAVTLPPLVAPVAASIDHVGSRRGEQDVG
jgi:hypothetical protein